jgi:tetratricopeptide (TPR) repeat protein
MKKWVSTLLLIVAISGSTLAQDAQPTPAPQQEQGTPIIISPDVFDRAATAYDAGNFEQAIVDYSLFILLNPTFSQGYYWRGMSYLGLEDYSSAINDLSRALELPSPSPEFTAEIYASRSAIYAQQERVDLALADLDAGLLANDQSPDLHYRRGLIYLNQARNAEALNDLDAVVALAPDFPSAYAVRGFLHQQLGDLESAAADFTQLITLTPDDPKAYRDRAAIYIQMKDYAAALADYNEVIELRPNSPGVYLSRGYVHTQLGNQAEAAADYLEWIRFQQTEINDQIVLRPGESQVVQIELGLVYIMFFEARANQVISLTASARADQGTDPLLVILDSAGNTLAADDDGGGNLDARISDFTVPADGVYTAVLSHAGGGTDGAVRVLLEVNP